MIRVTLEPAKIRGLLDKYVAERQKAQEQPPHPCGRQHVYHAAGGAFIALFETLTELFSGVAPEDHVTAIELQKLMQLTLVQYRQTAAMQAAESGVSATGHKDLFDLLYGPDNAS